MIFKNVDSSLLTAYMSSILLAVALIMGSVATTSFVDIWGRKLLIQISLIGSAIGLFAMAIYDYLKLNSYNLSSYEFVPVVSLSLVVFISASGVIPLSILVSIENLPAKVCEFYEQAIEPSKWFCCILFQLFQIRNISVAIIIFASNLTCFVYLKLFPPLLESIRLNGCMSICGILCVLGSIFIAIVLDETNGECLDNVGLKERKSKNWTHPFDPGVKKNKLIAMKKCFGNE